MSEAPFFAEVADAPPAARVVWLSTKDAVRIRVASWAGGDKGTVFLFPGRTECIEKYGRAAGDLLARGYSVITIDWRGQGLAARALPDPMSGHVDDFSEYQTDLDAMFDEAERTALPKPYFLMAHSMGGCIGLRALMRGLPFRAAAFSAPMWGISMAAWMRPVAHVVTTLSTYFGQWHRYAPGTGPTIYLTDVPFQGNVLTTDPEMWEYMRIQVDKHPELALGGPSLAWLRAALRECGALAVQPAPSVPAYCALGTAEKVVDLGPIHLRMATWSGGELDMYQGAEHEIMMEGPAMRKRFFDHAAQLYDANRG